jgi:hypothetical protein
MRPTTPTRANEFFIIAKNRTTEIIASDAQDAIQKYLKILPFSPWRVSSSSPSFTFLDLDNEGLLSVPVGQLVTIPEVTKTIYQYYYIVPKNEFFPNIFFEKAFNYVPFKRMRPKRRLILWLLHYAYCGYRKSVGSTSRKVKNTFKVVWRKYINLLTYKARYI